MADGWAKRVGQRLYRRLRYRPEHETLKALTPEEHARRYEEDLESLRLWIEGVDRTTREAKEDAELFRPESGALDSHEGRERLCRRWQSFLDYEIALDRIKNLHSGFAMLDPGREHARSFLLAYGSFLAQYVNGYRWIRRVGRARKVSKLLNERVPELGLEARHFDNLKWNVLHVAEIAKLHGGRAYLKHVRSELDDVEWLYDFIDRAARESARALELRAVRDFAANAASIMKLKLFRAWFPIQKGLADVLGHAMIRKPEPLVNAAQLASLRARLLPGDILLVRRAWKLSNIGLPGFWPHAALYVGTSGVMKEFFDSEDVRAFCRGRSAGCESFLEYLHVKYPGKWREFVRRPHEVVEAVAPTVAFHTLEEACDVDHVAVLRPRVSKAAVARAVALAFHYHGRPYDFNFDFETDHELVCSEVVYKAYEGALRLPLVSIAGRLALPPNDIAALFARHRGTPEQQLDFVDFLDGKIEMGHAVHGSAEDFAASHRRSKWQFATRG